MTDYNALISNKFIHELEEKFNLNPINKVGYNYKYRQIRY